MPSDSYPALRLRYLHLAHRLRLIYACQQILSYPRPVPLKPWLELGDRQSIDSRRSFDSSPRAHRPLNMLLRSTTASISRNASGFGFLTATVPDSAPESAQTGSAYPLPIWPYSRMLLLLRLASRSAFLLPCFTFGPSPRLRGTTMAAADFWRFIPAPHDAGSPKANRQISPGITHSLSCLCLSDLHHGVPCKYRALQRLARSPRRDASIRSLFVRPALCLRLPSDSTSRWTPLPFS